jgi:glutathione S-transferase
MRVLYQFPLSHYCEKARWLLDHKELDYVAHNLIPGFHRAFTYLKSGQYLLPMLKDDKRWVADSTQIALYLDSTYPEHALLRRDEQLREQALEIDKLSGELGVHVRRWSLAQALSVGDHPLEIMMGEQGYLRQFEKISKPILKSLVSSNYKLNPEKSQNLN